MELKISFILLYLNLKNTFVQQRKMKGSGNVPWHWKLLFRQGLKWFERMVMFTNSAAVLSEWSILKIKSESKS